MKNPTKSKSKIIITILVCALVSFNLIYCVSAQSTLVKAEASTSQPHVGDTLTVNIKISNAQNLFGIDLTLSWNPSVLELVSATSQLGVESHPGGVLYESSSYPIEVVDDTASQSSAEYHLLATSTGSSTSTFNGSGTIAIVTFRVTSPGTAGLGLTSELSDRPAPGETANLIDHTDTTDSVTAVASGSSSTPEPSPTVPEFPSITIITVLIIVSTATIALTSKQLKNKTNLLIK